MPSMDSNSSCYSSSESSTSSLSSPRVPITDIVQQQQPIRLATTTIPTTTTPIAQSHLCVTRYKTELCRPYTETGKCKYGDKCQFSHGIKELRILMRHPKYKTEYCRTFHTNGYCPYGPRCHFIHDIHEARIAINTNESILRRHSDIRTNQSQHKSTTRNRINSDYTKSSVQSYNSSKFPFSFEELYHALPSYDTSDVFQHDQQQQQTCPSVFPIITNTFTRRTFSSSSSSNSSLTPQYI
ncbi:unnamed protein product [Rotaria sordida]|uniref:C3H1-type domain-containing protein n=1 Tax=Rotaria sordida TaxID=392033 RepID=A0A814SHG5_9BILA|nr:unnamed protein product [Rotaria sordida]CAF1136179.1 unnamed protein product [Rotaria sordida]CAF1145024.1 unnamed protein product [Rotaria sordida]CAF1146081.1 unnamed protein product [Rotaria sordida]CAF1230011.1 unnamed protein product [Rotaria sordida]